MTNDRYPLTAFVLSTLLLGLVVSGCALRAAVPHEPTSVGRVPVAPKDGNYWWAYRFKVAWPLTEEPNWAVDLLLAHGVMQPVLRECGSRIIYWRFHRRAAHDKAGHQFSFFFYSDSDTATEVFRRVGDSRVLAEAMASGIVECTMVDDTTMPARPGVEDTSDTHWSPVLQRAWPAYIMGVSSLWLGLINDALAEIPGDSHEIRALLERYRQAETRVTAIWHKEGQHAFLHHLNAIFGYKPMLIRKEVSF
jgi:hypothetical protein